ncbi:unnamed protein product [Brassica oleracea var. botrytis]
MYCLQVAAYHLFFNAARLCYLLALLIFVFLRLFDIFHDISVVNHVGDSGTAAFRAITDTKKQVHGELNGFPASETSFDPPWWVFSVHWPQIQ